MEIEFNEEDKFIILDSDGIWELIKIIKKQLIL